MADESCAHRQVSYDPISRDGGYTDRWLCASGCGMEFVHAPYYKRGESIKIDAGDSGVITAVETWYCVQRGTVSQWFTAQDLSFLHDAPRGAQDARSASPEPGAVPDATEGRTEAGNAKADAETVALVRRLVCAVVADDITCHRDAGHGSSFEACGLFGCPTRRELRYAADAWLAQGHR